MTETEFKVLIPDEGIRRYIVENLEENPFSTDQNYYPIFHNIINLAFMYAFSCYTDLRNRNALEECRRKGNANSLRVLRTMDKIYKEYPISNELIQFILLDIQFDFSFNDDSKLRDYFPYCMTAEPLQLNEYFSLVNLSLVSSRKQCKLRELKEKLRKLIDFFPFLKHASLKFSEEAGWYFFDIGGQKRKVFSDGHIYTYGLIHRIKNGRYSNFYYLTAIEKNSLRYENFDRAQICEAVGDAEALTGSEIDAPYTLSWDEEAVCTYLLPSFFLNDKPAREKQSAKIEQLFTINYKYIKNLALAISDVVGTEMYEESGKALVHEFYKQHPEIFRINKDESNKSSDSEIFRLIQENGKNWDAIILMLLVEAGPSRVLNVVFRSHPKIAFAIFRNLKKRFGSEFPAKLQDIDSSDEFDRQAEDMIEIRQLHVGDCAVETKTYRNIHANLLAEVKAAIILSALSNTEQEKTYEYTGNIGQGVESLINFNENDEHVDLHRLCQAVHETLGVVLKRIACFYAGIFAYGKEKFEYDKKSESRLLPQSEIEEYQRRCKEVFENAATEQWHKLEKAENIVEALYEFVALCKRCSEVSETTSRYGRSDESRYLYAVLGKHFILDTDAFEREIKDVGSVKLIPDRDNAFWWRDKAIRLLRFFATGSFEKTHDSAQFFRHAIAPVVASYSSVKKSKDGYDTKTFYLMIDVDGDNQADYSKKINVLSEFSYDMHMQYYCLPNIVRSNDKWWIDPFMIECEIVDKKIYTR